MKRIDDIFKKGLDGKGLDFSDKYWDDVEALIVERNGGFIKRNKKLLLLLLLLITASIGAYQLQQTTVLSENRTPKQTKSLKNTEVISSKRKENQEQQTNIVDSSNPLTIKENNNIQAKKIEANKPALQPNNPTLTSKTSQPTKVQTPEPKQTKLVVNSPSETPSQLALEYDRKTSTFFKPKSNSILDVEALSFSDSIPWKSLSTLDSLNAHHSGFDFAMLIKPKLWSLHVGLMGNYSTYNQQANPLIQVATNYRPSISLGAGFSIIAKRNHWMIKTGADFLTLNEKTNYVTQNDVWTFDTSIVLVEEYYDQTPSGNRVDLYRRDIDSNVTFNSSIDCPNCPVSFSYVNVPIDIGYSFGKNRLTLLVSAGANLAFLYKTTGTYFTTTSGVESLSTSKNLTNVLAQFTGSIGPSYRLNQHFNLQLVYRKTLLSTSMMKAYKHKPLLGQLQTTLTYRIH